MSTTRSAIADSVDELVAVDHTDVHHLLSDSDWTTYHSPGLDGFYRRYSNTHPRRSSFVVRVEKRQDEDLNRNETITLAPLGRCDS
jgi:hypothetical protein